MRLAEHLTAHSLLVQAMSAWLVNTRRAPIRRSRDARVCGHTTTVMHKLSTPPRRTAKNKSLSSPHTSTYFFIRVSCVNLTQLCSQSSAKAGVSFTSRGSSTARAVLTSDHPPTNKEKKITSECLWRRHTRHPGFPRVWGANFIAKQLQKLTPKMAGPSYFGGSIGVLVEIPHSSRKVESVFHAVFTPKVDVLWFFVWIEQRITYSSGVASRDY